MQSVSTVDGIAWPTATFPSRSQRQEFVDQVLIWNRVEGLPRIKIALLEDGIGLRFFSADGCPHNILRLIDTFGGYVAG